MVFTCTASDIVSEIYAMDTLVSINIKPYNVHIHVRHFSFCQQISRLDQRQSSQLLRSRKRSLSPTDYARDDVSSLSQKEHQAASWRRILLLIVAITVHNIPG